MTETTTTEPSWSPYPDSDAAHFPIAKEINQSQLHNELEKALGMQVQLSTTKERLDAVDGYLWLVPSTVDGDVVTSTLEKHVADPEWGIPQSTKDYIALVRKVMEDPEAELSAFEVQVGIKGLLLRQGNS